MGPPHTNHLLICYCCCCGTWKMDRPWNLKVAMDATWKEGMPL